VNIRTRHFGEVTVPDDQLLLFPEGIVGFETLKRYALLNNPNEQPFEWLQSVEDPEIAFVLVDPLLFLTTYDFEVDDETISLLDIRDPAEIKLSALVTLRHDYTKMTANLLAPIVVNRANLRARQLVLHNSGYVTNHPIFGAKPGSEKEG